MKDELNLDDIALIEASDLDQMKIDVSRDSYRNMAANNKIIQLAKNSELYNKLKGSQDFKKG